MESDRKIKDVLARIHMNGPNLPAGKSYGELPIKDLPFYRPNKTRLDFILKHLPNNARIVDLGCNAGHMCFALAQKGHECIGVDNDEEALSAGRIIAEHLKLPVNFVHDDVKYYVFNGTDVILYLSAFQWIAKKHGLESAIQHLKGLKDQCKILFFETSGADSMAPCPEMSKKENIDHLLFERCGFKLLDCEKHKAETGGERWIYACTV